MKVLIVHVPYEHRGGEDVHVDALIEGYEKIGITTIVYPSDRVPPKPLLAKALRSLLPSDELPEIEKIWQEQKPAYIHVHNVFPILGPRFFRWAEANAIPLVMTVHNHRFFCTNGLALRDKQICKDCFHSKVAWRPIIHNCNLNWTKSVYHSIALTELRLGDFYTKTIKRYVAPSPYVQSELIRLGIPKEKVVHILNPVFWDNNSPSVKEKETYDVLYAGRLSIEKGINELMEAAKIMPHIRFIIAGDGPEKQHVLNTAKEISNITFVGPVSHDEVLSLIHKSRIAVLPSICNEILSIFVLEVFYLGKRCVVPALDSTSWLASGDFPGHLATSGSPEDLARAIQEALDSPPISTTQKMALQNKLGMERFCEDLGKLIQNF